MNAEESVFMRVHYTGCKKYEAGEWTGRFYSVPKGLAALCMLYYIHIDLRVES